MSNEAYRKSIVACARRWIGTPYLHQASTFQQGTDCLGLVRGVWRDVVGEEPETILPYSRDWGEASQTEFMLSAASRWFDRINRDDAAPGDLVLFQWHRSSVTKHAGILSGEDRFIHAYEKAGVIESRLNAFWKTRVTAHFRFPESRKQSS